MNAFPSPMMISPHGSMNQKSSQVWVMSPLTYHQLGISSQGQQPFMMGHQISMFHLTSMAGFGIPNSMLQFLELAFLLIQEYPFGPSQVLHYSPTPIGASGFHSMKIPTMMIQHPSYHHVMPPNGVTVPSGFNNRLIQYHLQRLELIKYCSLLEIWFGIVDQMVLLFFQRLKRLFMMLWRM